MNSDSETRTRLSTLASILRPSRSTLVVFGLLVGFEVQYFLRNIVGGSTPPGFETWLPVVVSDRLLGLLLDPVHWLVGLLYEQWAPDWVHFLVTLCYFYVLAVVASTLYGRLTTSE
ncbi:hypothetical protein [Natronorubrum sp. FCH18a]|uniref:hypothetical protein n=1 Tax=Natronorubrum sp. FCH18a TaxID=3447018 RepID=UPI003F519F07